MAKTISINIKAIDDISKTLKSIDKNVSSLNRTVTRANREAFTNLNKNLNRTEENTKNAAKETEKLNSTGQKLINTFSEIAVGVGLTSTKVQALLGNFTGLIKRTLEANGQFVNITGNIQRTAQVTGVLAKTAFALDKGILGLAVNLGSLSVVLLGFGNLVKRFDSRIADTIGTISIFAGILAGSLSLAITKLILLTGDLIFKLGTQLVNASQRAGDEFVKSEDKTFKFLRTVTNFSKVTEQAIGDTESWTKTIQDLSTQTGVLERDLQTATTEIVAATSQMGFSEEQMKKLLNISVDYANQLDGDVVKSTIAFIQALNGSSQSVIKYGVKLGEASVQNKIFKQGLDINFRSLSESEKIQARFNALLTQYKPIAGSAAASTRTLAGQQRVLENNVTRLNQKLGEGAALIENNNVLNLLFNKILNQVNGTILKAIGFFGALGGRVLQFTGFLVSLSLKVLFVIKVIKLLNILLSTTFAQTLVSVPIPFLNKSLTELIKLSGASFISFRSLTDVIKTFGSVLKAQTAQSVAALLGLQVQALSLTSVLRALALKGFRAVIIAVRALNTALLTLITNPIVLTVAAISAAIFLLVKAFQFLEERTGAISTIFNVLNDVISQTRPIFQPLVMLFDNFASLIVEKINTAIGFFINLLASLIRISLKLLKTNPFNIFSDKSIAQLDKAEKRLIDFQDSLQKVNLNIAKLPSNAARSVSGFNKNINKLSLDKIFELERQLRDVGKTELDILRRTKDERLKIIDTALKQELITRERFNKINLKIEQDFAERSRKIQEREQQKQAQGLQGLAQSFVQGGEGVTSLFANLSSQALDIFLPGLSAIAGQIVTPIIEVLAQGPEKVRETINAFTEQIPFIFENIVASLPVLVETLAVGLVDAIVSIAERFDIIAERFIEGLIRALPRIIVALQLAMPRVATALARSMPTVAVALAGALIKEAPNIVAEIIKGLREGISDIFKDLSPASIGGGGGGGGPLDFLGSLPGFTTGGRVPKGFSGDSFIAGLTSDEEVIDVSTSRDLRSFLSEQRGQTTADTNQELLARILNLLETPMNVTSIAEVDQEAFARIMINLDRTGTRTTA